VGALLVPLTGVGLSRLAAEESLPTFVVPLPHPPQHLTLEEARSLALANNKLLQAGRLDLKSKRIAVDAARTDYFPKLLAIGAYLHFNENLGTVVATRGRQLGGTTIGPGGFLQIPTINISSRTITANVINQDTAIGAIMMAQPITKLIGVSAQVDLARADAEIAAAKLDQGTRELLSGVTQAYYGLLAARRVKSALLLQIETVEGVLKIQPANELRLALLELRKGLTETEKQIAELTETLNQLLGLAPCTCLEAVEPLLPPLPVSCPDEAAQLALVHNPKIHEARQDVLKTRAGLKAARMSCLPDVNMIAAYNGQTMADYIQPDFAFVGVTGSYTLFEWGKRGEVKRERETQIAAATRNVEAVAETVALDARKAFLALKQAEEELRIANEVVKIDQDAEKDAKTPAALVAAKAATAKAQLDQMQAELNYRLAHAKLLAAIGHP
jgi:outer membrane protein TolC